MQWHLRCPTCGQQRPERAFYGAGSHQLEAMRLRGLGPGRGFDRMIEPMSPAQYGFLAERLEAASRQLSIDGGAVQQSAPACAACGWPAILTTYGWSCIRC